MNTYTLQKKKTMTENLMWQKNTKMKLENIAENTVDEIEKS